MKQSEKSKRKLLCIITNPDRKIWKSIDSLQDEVVESFFTFTKNGEIDKKINVKDFNKIKEIKKLDYCTITFQEDERNIGEKYIFNNKKKNNEDLSRDLPAGFDSYFVAVHIPNNDSYRDNFSGEQNTGGKLIEAFNNLDIQNIECYPYITDKTDPIGKLLINLSKAIKENKSEEYEKQFDRIFFKKIKEQKKNFEDLFKKLKLEFPNTKYNELLDENLKTALTDFMNNKGNFADFQKVINELNEEEENNKLIRCANSLQLIIKKYATGEYQSKEIKKIYNKFYENQFGDEIDETSDFEIIRNLSDELYELLQC